MPGPQGLLPVVVGTTAGPIEVAEMGSGPAVLCVHGIPGDWRQARALAEDLADRHRVLLLSRPGYGRTPVSVGRTYTEQADAYAALLDALGIDRCSIVGISGGGPSAASFADRHADRTDALVLLCAMAAHLVRIPAGMRLLTVPGLAEVASPLIRAAGRRRLRSRKLVELEMRRSLTPAELANVREDERVAADLLSHARTMVTGRPALAGLRNDQTQVRTAREPSYGGVRCPVLLIYGDADTVIGLDHARFYEEALADARLEIVAGGSHIFPLTFRRQTSGLVGTMVDT